VKRVAALAPAGDTQLWLYCPVNGKTSMRGFRLICERQLYAFLPIAFIFALFTSTNPSFSGDRCENPSVLGSLLTRPENRAGEFRIALAAPDYYSTASVQQHLLFSTVWGHLLSSELVAQTDRRCTAVIGPFLFPDLRVFLRQNRSQFGAGVDPSLCIGALREFLSRSQPSAEAIQKTTAEEARRKLLSASNSSGAMTDAQNILMRALAYIYDANTVMHALVSTDPIRFQSIESDAFLAWLQRQREKGYNLLNALQMCASNDGSQQPENITPVLPHSSIVSPRTIKLPIRRSGEAWTRFLRHVVIVGHGQAASNSQVKTAATEKYCNQERAFATELGTDTKLRVRCLHAVVHHEAWTVFFCDPTSCASERAMETVATTIVSDPDALAVATANARRGEARGPYLVMVDSVGDQ
jgi:hypothetical protein